MTDQCKHCTVRGDIVACQAIECHKHEDWYAVTLNARIASLEAKLKESDLKWIKVIDKLTTAAKEVCTDEQLTALTDSLKIPLTDTPKES